jgi:hypothetical protein
MECWEKLANSPGFLNSITPLLQYSKKTPRPCGVDFLLLLLWSYFYVHDLATEYL